MKSSTKANVFYSWGTSKNKDGKFIGTTTKNTSSPTADENGSYVKSEVLGTFERSTRVRVKNAAIQMMRYAKAKNL